LGYTSLAQNVEQDLNIKQNIKQMLRMQAATNILLKDLKQRIIKVDVIKNGALHLSESNNLIAQFLPLNTIKDVKEFESVLKTTDEAVTQFRELVSKTGGNNPKHTIQRTMKKIFTNECAMKCSWKGIKNNFRVSDLHLIKIMRNVTLQHMNLTESEFDNIVAEWLRFARQRKQREDKEKENERHNENEDQRINE
ncbi:uncharacterized protein LOC115238195, partial [Formica exsecta]|uniref:uncharacterized protein LOC115238195 n=1 Tax=Formica exsecta TaxID=72781 RepID=UPI001145134E